MFCKHLLGVRTQTNTDGVLQELGMTPIRNCALKLVVKNWERIEKGQANLLLKRSHAYAKDNSLLWVSNIKKLFATNGMLKEYLEKVSETEDNRKGPLAKKLHKRLTDQFHQLSFSVIHSSSKMKTLNLLKTIPGTESYLSDVTNSKHRCALTKLRLSSHRLEIETGRYTRPKTDAEKRYCFYCKFLGKEVVEDEIHFLITCPMYDEIRESLLPSNILLNNTWTTTEKFTQIMLNKEKLKTTAKFVYQAFAERQIKLDVLSTLHDLVSSTESILKNPSKDPGNNSTYAVKNVSKDGLKMTLKNSSMDLSKQSYTVKNVSDDGMKLTLSLLQQNILS